MEFIAISGVHMPWELVFIYSTFRWIEFKKDKIVDYSGAGEVHNGANRYEL